jgi:hypothetical protein
MKLIDLKDVGHFKKGNNTLTYHKNGKYYQFIVYENGIALNNIPLIMNLKQFLNYLYAELYI